MSEITKIVLTGGPCAGKTTALHHVAKQLSQQGIQVFAVSEAATELMNRGKTPESMGNYEFHRLLFNTQLEKENALLRQAEAISGRAVLLCDRGLLDNRVFVTADEFKQYSGERGLNEELLRNRYDAVFHLVSAADGAERFYSLENNSVRTESPELARKLDEDILAIWTGASHLRIIDNTTDFEGKLKRLSEEVFAVLGIPEPLEIERKFLIEMPDLNLLNSMKTCRRIPITQAYIQSPEYGQFRIRKRGEGDTALYIKTVKHKINDMKRVEIENYISKEEYLLWLNTPFVHGVISKDRYCIAWNSTYYELDVYPFWNDKATLEIELISENQSCEIPDFVNLIREVTFEKKYRNKQLAVKYSKYFR